MNPPVAVRWAADSRAVEILDQTRLPEEESWLRLGSAADVAEAIRGMRIRGAPAIGIAAAMGLALELAYATSLEPAAFEATLDAAATALREARPTAVNLAWAVDRLCTVAAQHREEGAEVVACQVWGEADRIAAEDAAMCRAIGEHALSLFPEPAGGRPLNVLTHCNAGALATGGIGTALAGVYLAVKWGRPVHVWVDETRPLLQGSRLTAWELVRAGIPATLIVDSVAGSLMAAGKVDLVITGADRIAANGDAANKIGTYPLAVLARHHGIPFYIAAPTSTIDPATPSGSDIPIEERGADEVRAGLGRRTAPADMPVHAPAFDVTPAALITAMVTDLGVVWPPYAFGAQAQGQGQGQ